MPAPHDPNVKAQVIEKIRGGESFAQAGAPFGIHRGTVSHWAAEAGVDAVALNENTRHATERANVASLARREEWRARTLDALQTWCDEIRDRGRELTAAGDMKLTKDAVIAVATLIDKTTLLAGEATSRSESLSIVADAADVRALKERLART